MMRRWIAAAGCALTLLAATHSAVAADGPDPASDAAAAAAADAAADVTFEAAPAMAPVAVPAAAPAFAPPAALDVNSLLHAAAVTYGIDEARFRRIARCESGLNPNAVSRSGYKGVFQFGDATWRWASARAGYAGWSVFDAQANIYSAA